MSKPPYHERGFILLMVLLIIPVIAVSMVSVARKSLVVATEAQAVQGDLQLKWGRLSSTAVFLPNAESILEASDSSAEGMGDLVSTELTDSTVNGITLARDLATYNLQEEVEATDTQAREPQQAIVKHVITLGGQDFELTFADEQAKVNINSLYNELGEQGTLAALDTLQADTSETVVIDLRPYSRTDAYGVRSRHFSSMGQVYKVLPASTANLETQLEDVIENPRLSDLITCWGGGQLNIDRAPKEVVAVVAGLVLKPAEVEQLKEAMGRGGDGDHQAEEQSELVSVIGALGLTEKKRAALESVLIDRSACYSLEITHHTGERTLHWLAVRESEDTLSDSEHGSLSSNTPTQSINRTSRSNTAEQSKPSSDNEQVYLFTW